MRSRSLLLGGLSIVALVLVFAFNNCSSQKGPSAIDQALNSSSTGTGNNNNNNNNNISNNKNNQMAQNEYNKHIEITNEKVVCGFNDYQEKLNETEKKLEQAELYIDILEDGNRYCGRRNGYNFNSILEWNCLD